MNLRENFTAEEWSKLQNAVFLVFSAVAGADGHVDKNEKKAFLTAIKRYEKIQSALGREVISSVGNKYDNLDTMKITPIEIEQQLIEISEILKAKSAAPEALLFKKNMIALGLHIGNSSAGFLGKIFGDKLSDDEVEALKRVGTYLNVSVAQLQQTPSIKELVDKLK